LCKRKAVSFGLTVLQPGDRLWSVFRGILERKYGGSLFESLLKKGEDAAKEELKETL
jgi:hypothetical protein